MGRTPARLTMSMMAAAFAVAWLVAATPPSGAAAGHPSHILALPQNFDASRAHGNEAEQTIAINPTNPKNIVILSTLPDVVAGLLEAYTFDGGVTWTTAIIANGGALGQACCDEQLAWDTFGNLWLTYLYNTSGQVPVALSTDGGKTFTLVTNLQPVISHGAPTGPVPSKGNGLAGRASSADQPDIAIGANSVWVSWTAEPSTIEEAAGASVTGPGVHGTFGAVEKVPGTTAKGDYGDVAIGPTGQVMVIYQYPTGGESSGNIYTALDADGLGSGGFATPVLLASTNVGGFDYIPAQADRSIDAEANLAWDRTGGAHSGRVYAVWTQETPDESNNTDIMVQHSDNNGTTWSAAVKINDDTGTNSQFMPSIALDETTGNVAVSWFDARNDLGLGGPGDTDGIPNDDAQIWATYSKDGGVTWVPNFQVSRGTSNSGDSGSSLDYGDYTHAAFQSHRFYPVWSDNSNSTGTNPDGTLHQLDLLTARVVIR